MWHLCSGINVPVGWYSMAKTEYNYTSNFSGSQSLCSEWSQKTKQIQIKVSKMGKIELSVFMKVLVHGYTSCITGHFWEESIGPVMQNFDVFFVVSLNKQTCYWWCGVTLIWWVIMSAKTKYIKLQCYRHRMLSLLDPVLFHSKPIWGGFGSGDWQNWCNLVNCLGIQLHTCLKLKDNSL